MSSSSDDLFRYKPKAAAVFHDSPRPGVHAARVLQRELARVAFHDARRCAPAAETVEARPARRPEQPQNKRARTRAIVADDEEEEPAIVDVVARVADPLPKAADESAWVRATCCVGCSEPA